MMVKTINPSILTATNGKEAVDAFSNNKGAVKYILMDLNMVKIFFIYSNYNYILII
jgi:CheY-like chemotaxis protein